MMGGLTNFNNVSPIKTPTKPATTRVKSGTLAGIVNDGVGGTGLFCCFTAANSPQNRFF
jgi:hypothetical protein